MAMNARLLSTGVLTRVVVGRSNEPAPTSRSSKLTGRFTPTGPNMIEHEALVEDREVLTAPFKIAYPSPRNDGYESAEYACREGDTPIRYYIQSTSPRLVGASSEAMSAEDWVSEAVVR
jgi:hypothetical protein